jgi:hypothetical protein
MKNGATQQAVEMPGRGKRGKPRSGFPPFPPPLEIAPRFPHSHRLDGDAVSSGLNPKERSPAHHHAPSGSSFDENVLSEMQFLSLGAFFCLCQAPISTRRKNENRETASFQ